jgi:hypothetical protein
VTARTSKVDAPDKLPLRWECAQDGLLLRDQDLYALPGQRDHFRQLRILKYLVFGRGL